MLLNYFFPRRTVDTQMTMVSYLSLFFRGRGANLELSSGFLSGTCHSKPFKIYELTLSLVGIRMYSI